MRYRNKGVYISTTTQLRECITEALSFLPKNEQKETIKKSCQRVFQAIRIDVNSILSEVDDFNGYMLGADCTIQGQGISNDKIRVAVDAAHEFMARN